MSTGAWIKLGDTAENRLGDASGNLLSAEALRVLDQLSAEERERWGRVVEGWLKPMVRLQALKREVESDEDSGEVPSYHVPSAEGVAVYQGMFGPNGALKPDDKKLVLELLDSCIKAKDAAESASE